MVEIVKLFSRYYFDHHILGKDIKLEESTVIEITKKLKIKQGYFAKGLDKFQEHWILFQII